MPNSSLTYPVPAIVGAESLTAEQIHQLLKSKVQVARRFAALTDQRFIADWLLTGRYAVEGGAVLYPETGDPIFTSDQILEVSPGAEYPMTGIKEGTLAAAKTSKRGHQSEIYDESIKRRGIDPVNRTLAVLRNTVVRDVDGLALAVIGSKVTRTVASEATWDTGAHIVEGVLLAKEAAEKGELGMQYDMSTILLSSAQYARVMAHLINGGLVPRENGDAIAGRVPVDALGLTWATSPNRPFTDPMLIDRELLGGMADEDLGSPEYTRDGNVDVMVQRLGGSAQDARDGYLVRARRVTVPIVIDPDAGVRITGTGL